MKEDKIVSQMVEEEQGNDNREVEIERQYNYYGDRGVVDVVVLDKEKEAIWVCEVKSDAAIREATGANEIIRQFKKHQEYFFKGVDRTYPAKHNRRNYDLIFAATDDCYRHLRENRSLYQNLASKEFTHILLRHPKIDAAGRPFEDGTTHSGWENQLLFARKVESIATPEIDESVTKG